VCRGEALFFVEGMKLNPNPRCPRPKTTGRIWMLWTSDAAPWCRCPFCMFFDMPYQLPPPVSNCCSSTLSLTSMLVRITDLCLFDDQYFDFELVIESFKPHNFKGLHDFRFFSPKFWPVGHQILCPQ
jgi:hypothetical protein